MKKLCSMVLGLAIAAGLAFGDDGLAPLTMTISTPGPDYYKDGTKVLDGETYLLVYLKTNAAFRGVRMNGTLVDPVTQQLAFDFDASPDRELSVVGAGARMAGRSAAASAIRCARTDTGA